MSSVFFQSNEVLLSLWKKHNPEQEQYLEKQKVIEWIKDTLKQTNVLENFQQSMTDLQGLIKQYLSEIHEVNEQNTHNLSLNYTEGIDFLKWLTDNNREENSQKNKEKQKQSLQKNQNNFDQNEEEQVQQQADKNQKQNQEFHQQENYNEQNKDLHQSPKANNHKKFQHPERQQTHNFHKVKTQVNIKQIDNLNEDEFNQNLTNNPNQFNLQTLSRKYKDYLRVIFDHYCKASYATGQDPTFQQIMHKTTIMTINKFMMFCKDFEIIKFNPLINRSFLIEIFKKNSECYKQMSFQQFCDVFRKLAYIGIDQKTAAKQEERNLISPEIVKFLDFCELSNSKRFKQKMKKLNIQYRVGPKTNAQLKVVPEGYKFKFTSNNGKSQQQIKQQLNERKIHRSQRKLLLRQKVTLNQNDLSLNKKQIESKKKQATIFKDDQPHKNQTHSTQIVNKILAPIAPPIKKLPPAPPKPNSTPIQSHNTNSTNSNNTNVFKKQLGYAQLHKLKQNQGLSRNRAITNSNPRNHDSKGTFKLNSIVEQARMEVMNSPHTQGNSEQLTQSIATNSRQQTHRLKQYDMNKINHKMQQINDKIKRDRQIQQELTGLLDIDDEQDEYLIQHLERQKKNQSIVKRLSNKINQLQMKR